MQLNELKLSGALEEFSITLYNFFDSKKQKQIKKNQGFECSLISPFKQLFFQDWCPLPVLT